MRTTLSALLLTAAFGGLAPAHAGTTCADVLGVEGSGQGLVCTVTCVQQYHPSVAPGRDPVVDPGRPACMDEDA